MHIIDTRGLQALLVSHELIRAAILWHELWHEGLEEASRLYFTDHNSTGMIESLVPLHDMLETVSVFYLSSHDSIAQPGCFYRRRKQLTRSRSSRCSAATSTRPAKLAEDTQYTVRSETSRRLGRSTTG